MTIYYLSGQLEVSTTPAIVCPSAFLRLLCIFDDSLELVDKNKAEKTSNQKDESANYFLVKWIQKMQQAL